MYEYLYCYENINKKILDLEIFIDNNILDIVFMVMIGQWFSIIISLRKVEVIDDILM